MERPFTFAAAALLALSTISPATAKGEPPGNAAQAMAAEEARQNAQKAQQMQAQNQQRQAQMQQQQAQQAQARAAQEQAVRAQEEQSRSAQMNAIRMQQAEAKQAQEQMRQQGQMQKQQQEAQHNQAAEMQKQQQEAQRNQAAQMQKQQQEAQRNQAAEMQKQQQEAQRNQAAEMQKQQQEAQRNQAAQMQREQEQHNRQPNQVVGNMNERMPGSQRQPGEAAQQAEQREARGEHGGQQIAVQGQHMNPGASFVRAAKPRPITANVIPTAKAVSMPVLEPGATAQEQQHAAAATKNLQRHLIAVPANQAPQNGSGIRNSTVNNYFNNYRTTVNNRQISINRQNTNFNMVPPTQFPHWWQPLPGWTYSNGFTLGDSINCGTDWLGWGWHPYWGPPPEGFVCESDYVPTPWFYIPSAGLWRQPGVMGYADYGPPYDYEGPITVEVMEPRHVQIRDPFTGWMNDRVVNVVYFYNAYYYPEFERYGYMNRHGYFIWLNFDDSDEDQN